MTPADLVPSDIRELYAVYDHRHAATILAVDFPKEFGELCGALREFRFTDAEVIKAGGNESAMPKKFRTLLGHHGWVPDKLHARMVVGLDEEVSSDTHIIDFVKGRIAF